MNKYVINKLNIDEFEAIVTLLDYETRISDYFKNIVVSSFNKNKLIVDTALCSGMNNYRFIEVKLTKDGTIDFNRYRYIDVDPQTLKIANNIIKNNQVYLNNSIITRTQKNLLEMT